jgi:outer membrane biosynthesis protein TonB
VVTRTLKFTGEIMSASIKYGRRKNLGNYEHEDLEIMIGVEDSQKSVLLKEATELRSFVTDILSGTIALPASKAETKTVVKETVVKKEEVKKVEEAKKEISKQGEGTTPEEKPPEAEAKSEVVTVAAPEEKKVEEPKKEEKKTTVKKETKIVAKKSNITVYDRELKEHKNNLGVFLDSKFPGWRKSENLKKAGAASRELHGKDFLDADGNILEAFKEAFSKFMVELV